MVGSSLSRFAKDQQWVVYDCESNGLNPHFSLPWEIAWGTGTLESGLTKTTVRLLRWPGFTISPHLALKTHFDPRRYAAEARDPREVWEEFSPVLYSDSYRPAGHNILGFDIHMISVWRRLMGLPPDHSWRGGLGGRRVALDTLALSKAALKEWVPDISSPEAMLRWQTQALKWTEKGLKANLGAMCEHYGVAYDRIAAHSAEYDIGRNALLLREIVKTVEC